MITRMRELVPDITLRTTFIAGHPGETPKDFGELVFVWRLPHPCIIRFVDMPVEEKVTAMRELLERYADAMQVGGLIVVTRGRVRIRLTVRK